MSWVKDYDYNFIEKFAVNVMRQGPIPSHVGFIMDGNRRYAKQKNLKKNEGHERGSNKLMDAVCWCQDLGIKHVTFYAFSIENFKRPKDEVDFLMELLAKKLSQFINEEESLERRGIRIQIIGDMKLFPLQIQNLMAKSVLATKFNEKIILNLACGYTSRWEVTKALNSIKTGLMEKSVGVDDVNELLIDKCLFDGQTESVDLIVRTSGESRLSDFLLWQVSD